MVIRCARFNTYLLLSALVVLLAGCQSAATKRKHQLATLKLHLEATPDRARQTKPISICRDAPINLNVEPLPFLDETMITRAAIIEMNGAFAVQVQFDQRGTWLLEQYSARSLGKRFAIFSEFGPRPKDARAFSNARWLAAPLVQRRLGEGLFSFTPDADRKEAEDLVLGLNNVAKANEATQLPADSKPEPR